MPLINEPVSSFPTILYKYTWCVPLVFFTHGLDPLSPEHLAHTATLWLPR